MTTLIQIQESIADVKSNLKNAKARHKAALKAYDKAFEMEDEIRQGVQEHKIETEQELIDDLSRELEELENKIKDVEQEQEHEQESLGIEQESNKSNNKNANKSSSKKKQEEVEELEQEPKQKPKQESKQKPKKPTTEANNNTSRTSYNTKSGDWPQHSYRVPPEVYEPLKRHIKQVSMFNNLADMSRSLCMGDYDCSIFSLSLNHATNLMTRFIEMYDSKEELSKRDKTILDEEFKKMNASTKEQKNELMKDLKSIRNFIKDKELYRFQVKDEKEVLNTSEEE